MNSTQPSLARVLLSRELGQHRRSKQPSLDHGRELHHKLIGSTFVAPTGSPSMPYAVTFCKHIDQGHLLATSCEDGFVSILDASKKLPCYITGEEGSMPRAHWQAHRNAVFDVVWAKDDQRLLTPSGDMTVGVWDTHTASLLFSCQGHTGSVKSVCPLPSNEDIFATGSRDGAIMLWDTRSPTVWSSWLQRRVITPTWEMHDAHSLRHANKTPPSGRGGRKDQTSGLPQSITSVVFIPHTYMLASSGSGDTTVKLWDMRKACSPITSLHAGPSSVTLTPPAIRPPGIPPCSSPGAPSLVTASFSCRGSGPFGVTCMAASHQGSKLLVNCTDSRMYLFDTLSAPSTGPASVLSGHHTPPGSNSFYVKCGFSPDGTRAICGSMDEKAYIWEVGHPLRPPVALVGHERPGVCAVAWSPCDPMRVASASDDMSVKVWDLQLGDLLPRRRPCQEEIPPHQPEEIPASTYTGRLDVIPLRTPSTPIEDVVMVNQQADAADTAAAAAGEARTPLALQEEQTPGILTGWAMSILRHDRECTLTPLQAPELSLTPFPAPFDLEASPSPLMRASGPSLMPSVPGQHETPPLPMHCAELDCLISSKQGPEAQASIPECVEDGGREISLCPDAPPPHDQTCSSPSTQSLPSPPSLAVLPGAPMLRPIRSAISPLMSLLRGASRSQGGLKTVTPTSQKKGTSPASDFSQSPILRRAFDMSGNGINPLPSPRAQTADLTDVLPSPKSAAVIPQDNSGQAALKGSVKHTLDGSAPPPYPVGSLCEEFDEDNKENIDPAEDRLHAEMTGLPPPPTSVLPPSSGPAIRSLIDREPMAIPSPLSPGERPAASAQGEGPSVEPAAIIALVTLVVAPGNPDASQGSASLKRTWQPPPIGALSGAPREEAGEREAKRQELMGATAMDVEQEETEETTQPSPAPAVVASYSWGHDSQVPCSYPDEDSRPISGCANSPLLIDALGWKRTSDPVWSRRGGAVAGSGDGVVDEADRGRKAHGGAVGPSLRQGQQDQLVASLDAASRCAWEPGCTRPPLEDSDSEGSSEDYSDDGSDDYDEGDDNDMDEPPRDTSQRDADWGKDDGGKDLGPGVFLMRGHPPAGPPLPDTVGRTPLVTLPAARGRRPAGPAPAARDGPRMQSRAKKPRTVNLRTSIQTPTAGVCPVPANQPPQIDGALRANKVKQRTLLELWGAKGEEEEKQGR